ncbi:MAG TPA: site-2 protease family protein [Blastocatellia bacterium]|nr:site-2 protease family protein [Blastocatellia bacterium]
MRFKVFGIPVRIDFTFWIMIVILGDVKLSQPDLLAEWVGVVLVSVLVHELGHALIARRFGREPRIQLYGMGGLTSWDADRDFSHFRSILISLSGPGAGFLLASVTWAISLAVPQARSTLLGQHIFHDLMWVNFAWGVFNLFPILPLDGGNVMGSIEEWMTKKPHRTISHIISMVLAAAIAIVTLAARGSLDWWIAMLGGLFALTNLMALVQARASVSLSSSGPGAGSVTDRGWRPASPDAVATPVDPLPLTGRTAQESIVRGHIQSHDFKEARLELDRLEARFGPDPCLEAYLLTQSGQPTRAISVLQDAYTASKAPKVGNMLANLLIRSERFNEAMELASDPNLAEFASSLFKTIQAQSFSVGNYRLSAEAGRLGFARESDPAVAYNVACALARASEVDEAIKWVSQAMKSGFRDLGLLSDDPDMAPLKGHPEFDRLVKSTA